jgi:hypothetical protein
MSVCDRSVTRVFRKMRVDAVRNVKKRIPKALCASQHPPDRQQQHRRRNNQGTINALLIGIVPVSCKISSRGVMPLLLAVGSCCY